MPCKRILIVEDDELIAFSLEKLLRLQGYEIVVASTVGVALSALDASGGPGFDHVLLDLHLPDADGENVLSHAERMERRPRAIVIAAPQSLDGHRVLSLRGRCEILPKPVIVDTLLAMLEESLSGGIDEYAEAFALSQQEQLVLDRAVGGMDDVEIGAVIRCSHSTVKSYWSRIYAKLAVKGRDKAIAHFARWLMSERPRKTSPPRRAAKPAG